MINLTVSSLAIIGNLLTLLALFFFVRKRGGLAYVKSRLMKSKENMRFAGYLNREGHFRSLTPARRPVVFLGDSITQNAEWSELFPNASSPVLNRGIGGDTSAGVLDRLQTIITLNPITVFLMIGTNDQFSLNLSPEETVENIKSIASQLRAALPDCQLFVHTLLPGRSVAKNVTVNAINALLWKDGIPGSLILDMHHSFLKNEVLNPDYSYDGLHLNGAGYALWVSIVKDIVEK